MHLASGVRFGRYLIRSRIGVGGMAEVWEADDPSAGRRVAVKVILDAMSDDPKFVERFLREARILARLQHAHIIPVFDFGEEQGDAFLVTPFLPGGSLAIRLRQETPSSDLSLRWLKELGSALDFAHAAGVIHRDVKPSNVLFDAAGHLYLSDFGLAKASSSRDLTTTGAAMGTPLYMSPEQIRGEDLDHRTDVYGLGIVAYQLLSGQRLFAGDAVATVLHKTLNVAPPPPSSVNAALSRSVDAVVLRALAKDRRRRYDGCGRFVTDLGQALDGTLTDLSPLSLTEQEAAALAIEPRASSARPSADLSLTRSLHVPSFSAVTPERGRWPGRVALALAVAGLLGGAYAFRERLAALVEPKPNAALSSARGGGLSGASPQVRLMLAKQRLDILREAFQGYAIEHGRYPPGPWPTARKELVPAYGSAEAIPARDPWDQAYRYAVSSDGKTYVVVSPGNDGVYQMVDSVVTRLLGSRCRTASEVVTGDDTTTDIVVCNGTLLTQIDLPTGAPR